MSVNLLFSSFFTFTMILLFTLLWQGWSRVFNYFSYVCFIKDWNTEDLSMTLALRCEIFIAGVMLGETFFCLAYCAVVTHEDFTSDANFFELIVARTSTFILSFNHDL